MKRDKLRPKLDPSAPLVPCDDCNQTGRRECTECAGSGLVVVRWRNGFGEDSCTECDAKGEVACTTCDGDTCYPDPEACLLCPFCDEYLEEDTAACMLGCGYVWAPPAKEVA